MDEHKVIKQLEARKKAIKKYQQSEKGKEAKKRYEKSAKGKAKRAKILSAYMHLNPRGKANNILHKMKSNSAKRGHLWSDDWWTIDQIQEIIENGKCAQTGLSFKLRMNSEDEKYNRNPFAPSPDRIDLTKGYEPSNVQWVVLIYNLMKNTFNDEDIAVFVNALKEK